jgi:sensor domain CHASE-containing protein
MTIHDIILLFIFAYLIGMTLLVIMGLRKWAELRKEVAAKTKTSVEAKRLETNEKMEQAMAVSREHLEVSKQLLLEIKALREEMKKQ